MKKFLARTGIAAAVLCMAYSGVVLTSSNAATPKVAAQSTSRQIASLTRQLDWTHQHINRLNRRRDYLKSYIRHLRKRINAPVSTASNSGSRRSSSTASYPSGVLSASQVASYARGAGFPESVIPTMVAFAYRESRFNPGAINSSSGACGLWQLYPCPGPSALSPSVNASLAYQKYRASGLSPWGG